MRIQLLWERLGFSRLTIAYFVFALVHCVLQIAFQARAFIVNKQAADMITAKYQYAGSTVQGDTETGFADLSNDEQSIVWCTRLGHPAGDTSKCEVLWPLPPNSTDSSVDVAAPEVETSAVVETLPVVSTNSVAPTTTAESAPTSAQVTDTPARPTTVTSPVRTSTSDSARSSSAARVSSSTSSTQARITSAPESPARVASLPNPLSARSHPEDAALNNVTCLRALVWPTIELDNTKREDLAFLLFQIWVLGMSIVAILNESIPHTIAAFLTHLVSTGWGGYQIFSAARFNRNFGRVILHGACEGSDLLSGYWQQRNIAEIASLALNVAALVLSAVFTLRLIKQFGWQTYKHVGASLTIARVYRLVLLQSILIQFGLFFVLTTVALWLDQIRHGRIGKLSQSRVAFTIMCAVVLVATIPWLMTGWFGVRRESRLLTIIFLGLCLIYMGGWAAMLVSLPFRWTFVVWNFFGMVATTSVAFTFFAFVLGVLCLSNFGKGLPTYLRDHENSSGSSTKYPGQDSRSETASVRGAAVNDVEAQANQTTARDEYDLRRQISLGGRSIASTQSSDSNASWSLTEKSARNSLINPVPEEKLFVIE